MAITVKHKFVSAIPDGTDATIVRPSNWNDDHDLVGTVPVANGGTGVTTSSGANSVVLRDANVNINANAFNDGYTNTAASGTQIVLTASSVRRYTITGSGGQTIKLPDATTLLNGEIFEFDNNQSSGAITVNNNSNTLVVSVPSGGLVRVNLLSNSIAAGSWDRHDYAPANVSWSTNTFDYAGSFTNGTWNGNAVAYNRGGTGQSAAFVAGGIVYGSTTTALAVTAIGTTGQVLTSAGAGTPTWTTPSPMVYPASGIPNSTGTAWGTSYSTTGSGTVVALATRPTMSVTGAGLTLQDATDNTKTANFDLTGLTTGTNYTYALPAFSGSTLAVLGATQTFTATQTFSGINVSGIATSTNIGTSLTTGVLTLGGTATTSILTVGRSTVSQTTNIQAGITASGSTKTINIGTAGASGSTTTIAIGSTTGTSTTTVNGILKQQTYTVATLPSASTSGVGSRSFVTDALAPAFGATVVTGGAIAVPVYSDGTNWKVG